MFSTVLQELQGYFNRDFVLAAFFPLLIFFGASLALYMEITTGIRAALAEWDKLSVVVQGVALLSALVFVAFVAYLADNLHYTIVHLFEGYWSRIPILWRFKAARIHRWQQGREYLDALAASATTDVEWTEIVGEQLLLYPPPGHLDRILPTMLGNAILTAELYAFDRYGLDAGVMWPRLRPVLKPETLTALDVKMRTIRFMLLMTILAFVFAVWWCIALTVFTDRWELVLLCGLGLPIAWLCYQNAIESAFAYSAQFKAIIDLYRNELFTALKRPVPAPGDAERLEWQRLAHFWYYNAPLPPPDSEPPRPSPVDRAADGVARALDQLFPPQPGAPGGNP